MQPLARPFRCKLVPVLRIALPALLWVTVFLSACSTPPQQQPPNILLLVADDLGYADLGCYGGDIATPNIDSLAARGIRFSRFYAAPMCAPSRAMLLSGNDNHIAGVGVQNYRSANFGYEGELSDRIIPVPVLLREAGYNTMISGKWHLGETPETDPVRKGFDQSFVSLPGASNHFSGQGLLMDEPTPYTENGRPVQWPEGRFSTDVYTDKLIEFLKNSESSGKPFFAFAAYTAPHWPLQVDEKYHMKYAGRYNQGYEKLREERLKSLKNAGMVPENATLPELHPSVRPWNSLTSAQQQAESRKMELYAGMLDNLDENIGRIISYLRNSGQLDNTLIIFMSDNGAGDEDYYNDPYFGEYLQSRYDNSLENMGKPGSFVSYGPPWAEAGTGPFRYFKGYLTEGGIRAAMIMAGPGVKGNGTIYHGITTIMDLAPTFYELAGVSYPDKPGLYPVKGTSLWSMASGKSAQVHPAGYVFAMEHNARTMLLQDNWKLTQNDPPLALDKFEVYDLEHDIAEQTDLRDQNEQMYERLFMEWDRFYRYINGMIPPE